MFRCCLPCRGGSASAPATSPPSSPESSSDNNYTNITIEPSINLQTTRLCQSQTSPLPHIEEEEELDQSHQTTPDDNCAGLKEYLVLTQRSRLTDRHTTFGDEYSSSPSPRTKQNRKQTKGRTRSVTSTTSSETGTFSGGCGSSVLGGATVGGNSVHSTNSIQLSGFLLPKMQAEQGSIGDLQKYHSRYLKNRRHTLANVR